MSVNMPSLPRLPSKAKFWKKKSSSAKLTEVDPSYRAIYLGNVLTGWAKGDGCVDKPLATLWKNHLGTEKPNIIMKVTVCPSGLKAVTKEHGLTEYWANRITYCTADPAYPKVFCWIYRHEGRKLKQELRCHAVLCPSVNKANLMADRLRARLHQALVDFKKEKLWRQNARLSLANSVYDNPTMPQRKMLLNTGSMNYRPPLERGKAASKLKVIEEVSSEDDYNSSGEEINSSRMSTAASCQMAVNGNALLPTTPVGELANLHSTSESCPLIVEAEDEYEDTDGSRTILSSSDVASISSYPSTLSSSDTLSLASTCSTVIDHPPSSSRNVSSMPAGHTTVRNNRQKQTSVATVAGITVTATVVDIHGSSISSDDDDDDDDVITNHLNELTIDGVSEEHTSLRGGERISDRVNHPAGSPATQLPNIMHHNHHLSREESHVDGMEADHQELSEASPVLVTRGKMSSSDDPDTISDESGYSEESNATLSSAGSKINSKSAPSSAAAHKCEPTVILSEEAVSHHNLNGHPNPASNLKTDFESSQQQQQPMTNGLREDPLEGPQPAGGVVDLSVKGVLISEFSSSEQLRYLERRRSRSVSPFAAGQIQPDFCINI